MWKDLLAQCVSSAGKGIDSIEIGGYIDGDQFVQGLARSRSCGPFFNAFYIAFECILWASEIVIHFQIGRRNISNKYPNPLVSS